jgi:YegS/Rv2252/BmrU family lipid kinase
MSDTLLIVNPRAGGGRTGRTFEALRARIEAALGGCDVAFTQGRGDGIRIARDACAQGRRCVVAVGGDGSVHETVNGLMEGGGGPVLGIIGTGTGGDFTKTLGISHDLERYLATIREGHDRHIDVGKLTYRDFEGSRRTRYFANILSMGMSGLVDRYVATAPRWWGSKMAYYVSSLRALAASRAARIRVRAVDGDGTERDDVLETRLLAVCNGRYFGSGMRIAPMARPDDGRFEIIAVTAKSRLRLLGGFNAVYAGTHVQRSDVHHSTCTRLSVELLSEDVWSRFLLDVDGEPLGGLPVEVELVPGAIAVRAPSPTP